MSSRCGISNKRYEQIKEIVKMLGYDFDDEIYHVEADIEGSTTKLTATDPFQITFEENGENIEVGYTVAAVKFYKPVN